MNFVSARFSPSFESDESVFFNKYTTLQMAVFKTNLDKIEIKLDLRIFTFVVDKIK